MSAKGRVAPPFRATMLVLAGGFVRYPSPWMLRSATVVWRILPAWLVRTFFHGYAVFARWRHRHAPETAAAIREFIDRRTAPDLRAMGHRLELIRKADFRPLAGQTRLPVYQLTGRWDPVVFYPRVRKWLRRNCPGYRETRVLSGADHNVLGTAPEEAAGEVMNWLRLNANAGGPD